MTTCSTCQRGPADDRDSAHCATVGHRVYHETPACRDYAARGENAPAAPPPTQIVAGWITCCGKCGAVLSQGGYCRVCTP